MNQSDRYRFRAWLKEHWCREGDYISRDDYGDMEYDYQDTILFESTGFTDEFPIMMFAGVIDINGKDIYEKDFVTYKNQKQVYSVEWVENESRLMCIATDTRDKPSCMLPISNSLKVVGNLYERVGK